MFDLHTSASTNHLELVYLATTVSSVWNTGWSASSTLGPAKLPAGVVPVPLTLQFVVVEEVATAGTSA